MLITNENQPLLIKETAAQILLPMGDFHSQRRCELVCKLWYDIFNACSHYQVAKENYFAKEIFPGILHYPLALIEALGGKKKVVQLPVLPSDLFYGGFFDSIIFFDNEALGEHPVYRFEYKNRQGIAIGYTLLQSHYFDVGVILLHQDHQNRWMQSGLCVWPSAASYEDLGWLLAGEFLTVDDNDRLMHFQLGCARERPLTHKLDALMHEASTVISTVGTISKHLFQLSFNAMSTNFR